MSKYLTLKRVEKNTLIGIVLCIACLAAAYRGFGWPSSETVIWFGTNVPAHAAAWNILAFACMLGGCTVLDVIGWRGNKEDGRFGLFVFWAAALGALAMLAMAIRAS